MAERHVETQKRNRVVLSASLILVAIVAVTGFASAGAISRQMHAWKLLPEPERLTELYFTNSTTLPTGYQAGSTQTVAFTIHNLEYKTVTYRYTVYQISQTTSQKAALGSGTVTLAQNQYAHPSVPVTLTDLGSSKVSIALQPVNETIDYLLKEQS